MKLLFGACSFGCIYYAGIIKYIQENLPEKQIEEIHTVSSGCMAGISLLLKKDISELKNNYVNISPKNSVFGKMSKTVENGIRELVKTDENAKYLSNKLFISYTSFPYTRKIVSTYDSLDDLVNKCLASCYIPIYFEKPIYIDNWLTLDGKLTTPVHIDGFVSIHPCDNRTSIHSKTYKHNNLYPYDFDLIDKLIEDAYEDAKNFFDENLK